MNAHHDLERRLEAAFEDGPSRVPERSIEAALAHAHAHPRRRDPLAALRRDPMATQSTRFAFAIQPLPLVAMLSLVLVAGLAIAGAGGFFDDRAVVVPPVATPSSAPSPSPAPTASASVSPSRSPSSPTVIAVDLIDNVGADASIDIIDRSGTLLGAVSGTPGDGTSVPDGMVAVTGLTTDPATVVLTWSGLPCNTTHQLTIAPDGLGMSIERPACQGDAMGIDHVLVLTFDRPVDAATVDATIRTTGT